MESGDRVALLARVALYPTSIPRVPEYTRIDGRIDGVELLLSNPDPEFPGSLKTHTRRAREGDKDKGIMENRYVWCWFSSVTLHTPCSRRVTKINTEI